MASEKIKDVNLERSMALREADKEVIAANTALEIAKSKREQIRRKWNESVDIALRKEGES